MKSKWIFYTFLFVLLVVTLLGISIKNPILGLSLLLILFLTAFVGTVLKAYFCVDKKYDSKKLKIIEDENIIENQNLLRYATAILAFLSLMTTEKGMNSFVFSQSWMAYLGSFAVQSILVSFSLLLCRFFVQITALNWPSYIKRIVNGSMIIFFCIALIVSSVFSFSYIANNAYKESWPSDSETIVQEFLLKETDEIKLENEKCGKIILNSINKNAHEDIEETVNKSKESKVQEWNKEITKLVNRFSKKKLKRGKVNMDKGGLLRRFPQYQEDINYLSKEYKTYSKQYDQTVDLYNGIIDKIKKNNSTQLLEDTEQWIGEIDSASNILRDRRKSIYKVETYHLDKDFSAIQANYFDEAGALLRSLSEIKKRINEINKLCANIDKYKEEKSSDDLDDLLSKIYMLGVDNNVKVEDLVQTVNGLVLDASKDENYTSKEIEKIIVLKDELNLYKDYNELKDNLLSFTEEKVKKTYFISDKKKGNNKKKNVDKEDEDSSISYKKWKEIRKEDFKDFSTYVKDLPDMTIYSEKVFKTEYNADSVLEKASLYERDLLGDLTDIEKAFNYFKYRFPMMAYFSAFIAVFFDLGSFFTGCFLYATEYFKKKSDDEDECEKIDAGE